MGRIRNEIAAPPILLLLLGAVLLWIARGFVPASARYEPSPRFAGGTPIGGVQRISD
jgi:hypothetical protein